MRNTVPWHLPGLAGLGAVVALGCGGSDLTLPGDGRAADLAVVAGNEQAGAPGHALPEPLVVRATDAAQAPVSQVRIAFVVTAGGGSTAPDTTVTDADGRASARWTLGTSMGAQAVEARVVGADPVRVTFLGTASGGGPGGLSPTTTEITSISPSPSFPTQPVVVAFRVTSTAGTPTGTLTLSDGTASCTGTAPTGQCTIAPATAGTKTITARYGGSGTFAASSASASHEVKLAPTATSLSSSPNPSEREQVVTFSVAVTSSFGMPTGSVHLVEGTCTAPTASLGTESLNAAGKASFSIQTLTGGTHEVLACYNGNDRFAPSVSPPVEQRVSKKGRG